MKTWIFRLAFLAVTLFLLFYFLDFGLLDLGPEASSTSAFAGPASDSPASTSPASDHHTLIEVEKRVFELTNNERRHRRLPALAAETTLAAIARAHSADMLRRGFFSHVNPDQESVADRVAKSHRQLIGLSGENLWSGSGQDQRRVDALAKTIVEGWMASPGHRENILRPAYTHLGVAVVASGQDLRATQVFARVIAFLNEPLPLILRQGSEPNLRMRVQARNQAPAERFDLWSPRRQKAAIDSTPIDEPALRAPPGSYSIRFHFPDEKASDPQIRRYQVFFGPGFELR